MATIAEIKQITALYVGYFDRAPDPEGLQFWIDQLDNGRDINTISQDFAESYEAKDIYPYLRTPDVSSPATFITQIYLNLFGRAPDDDGFNFWMEVLESGAVSAGDMVEAVMMGAQDTIVDGQFITDKTILDNKCEAAMAFTDTASGTPGFEWDQEAYQAARGAIDGVDETAESVQDALNTQHTYFSHFQPNANWTLCEQTILVSEEVVTTQLVTKNVLYWGYNPHGHGEEGVDNTAEPNTNNLTNEGPADGGIPADVFFNEYLPQILGVTVDALIDLTGGDNADDEYVRFPDLDNLEKVTIGEGAVLTFHFGDGTSDDVHITEEYFDFVSSLIFDAEGNSRFFEKEVAAGVPVYLGEDGQPTLERPHGMGNGGHHEPIGYVDAVLTTVEGAVYATIPPILTPSYNNGGTFEGGFTSYLNDTIVAGHLELLHGAIIDGGQGYNTLEIDAKGHFAQPKSLINIQQISIHNLANVYTTDDENSSQYPDVVESNGGSADSVIDLSRATELENVTITEGEYYYIDADNYSPGSISVVGLRNNATLTLQGGFYQDVYVSTSEGYDEKGFTVHLENVNSYAYLYIADNSGRLNLVSDGGANNLESIDYWNDNRVTQLYISGGAHLFIEDGLEEFMEDESPVLIDASANTGGVDLNMDDYNQGITFIGSKGSDRVSFDAYDDSSTSEGPDYGDDAFLHITNTQGDNYYDLYSPGTLELTDGNGDIILKADVGGAVVSLGNGDNTVAMEVTELNLTVGHGNNFIDIDTNGYTDSYINKERFNEDITIVAGDGANEICVEIDDQFSGDVANVDITAGNGGNIIEVKADDGDTPVDVTINTGAGSDTIKAAGSSITINSGGGNDSITLVGIDDDFVFDEVDVENGSGGSAIDSENEERSIDSREFNDGALLNINTGPGSAHIHLGMDGEGYNGLASMNIIAKDGSVITGEDITLHVNTYANLIAADLSGITGVILDDDAGNRSDSAQANDPYAGDRSQLTLTAEQFLAIGAQNFSVDGAVFNTHAFLKIIVSQDTSLTALGVDSLPRNIDLYFEIEDGAELTMTAEQLHTRVARDGITISEDGNTDLGMGSVVITEGGLDFDPFNTNDRVQSVIAGNTYYGGSLSQDFMVNGAWFNVQVKSVYGGYDRPADVAAEVYFTINSDIVPEVGAFDTWHNNVEIIGTQDIDFTGAMQLGLLQGMNSKLFTVDFSELEGEARGLTLGNFEMVQAVYGNSTIGYDTEVFVEIIGNSRDGGSKDVGFDSDGGDSMDGDQDDRALISQGVLKYTVTVIDGNGVMTEGQGDTATIRLCDQTEDLETIALRGNWNDTLEILDAAHGLNFELQGGSTLKREGPTHTSNVGKLDASFKWDHASTTVDIIHSVEGDTRPIDAAGIVIDNADSITVNAEGPAVTIGMLMGNSLNSLDLNADGDMTLEQKLPVEDGEISMIDASGVAGVFTAGLDGGDDGNFTFIGGDGGSVLTLCDIDDDLAGGVTIDGGTGGVALIIEGSNKVDLDESTLTNVTSVTLADGASLQMTMDQIDAIGADNFFVPDGSASIMIKGLAGQEFSLASFPDFPDGLSIMVMLADDPKVELHPNTDLTGISGLFVPAGTTLCLTMAQFQQLNGDGDIDGGGNLIITDVMQADVGPNGSGLDMDDVDIAGTVTLILAESVDLSDADLYSNWNDEPRVDVFEVGDDMTLILGEVTEADGVIVNGGANSTLQFTDTDGFLENIDASGFDVDELRITDLLVSGNNVDYIFAGLLERVTKVIYNDDGKVGGRLQNVVIEESTTIFGDISFNEYQLETEVSVLTVNMEGGVLIDGDLIVSTVEVNLQDDNLVPMYLMELNINSTGTAANNITGKTENVIYGDITPLAYPPAAFFGSRDNNLKTVNISGDQALNVMGTIIFNSHGDDEGPWSPDDGVTANDDNAATATLNVNNSAAVVINDIDTGDGDVDFLVVNNMGTGDLTIGISSFATVDASDVITLNGSATGTDTVVVSGGRDFSGDTINADWDFIQFNNDDNGAGNVVITVTQQQFLDIGVAGFLANGDGTALNNDAILNLVAFDGSVPFDATGLDGDINVGTITMLPGVQTLDPSTNLTGVGQICVPEGGTLNLTAAQYQQLVGIMGVKIKAIDGADANGTIDAPINVNITDLTQADIDGGAFDLSMINTGDDFMGLGNVTVDLAESVELSDDDVVQTFGGASNVEFILTDGEDLGIDHFSQADGLEITGTGTTDVFFRFADNDGNPITFLTDLDVSGYDVTQLHALNVFVGGFNVEFLLSELDSAVKLVIYFDPEDLGMLNLTDRMVIIEPETTIDANVFGTALAFNDLDTDDEVFTVMITALGGTIVDGAIALATTNNKDAGNIQKYLQSFTYVSEGDGTQVNYIDGMTTANVINGAITPFPTGFAPSLDENNLLDVNLLAVNDLFINGPIYFNGRTVADDTASLDVSGTAPVTIQQLNVEAAMPGAVAAITDFSVNNTGTGTLTITGASNSIDLSSSVETLIFTGIGDIVLDTTMSMAEGDSGIKGPGLSTLDATGLSGNLTLGVVEDVDNDDFSFTAGSGVTTMTMAYDDLAAGATVNDTGWSFDFSNAAAGSQLTLGLSSADGAASNLTFAAGSDLNIDMGANGVLCIQQDANFSAVNLMITSAQPIVVKDGVTLTLTAAQADGLTFVGENGAASTGVVHITGLGNDPVDLSGISPDIAGYVFLEDDDVTLDPATDLGPQTVGLEARDSFDLSLIGQTIRFSTEDQASGQPIDVIKDVTFNGNGTVVITDWDDSTGGSTDDNNAVNSTNVVFLFDTVSGPLNTFGFYDASIGRVWFKAALLNSLGGDVENLFDSLANSILRVDFNTLEDLVVLEASAEIHRIIELTSFSNVVGITEVDDGFKPEEHIETLTIFAGGQVMSGDVVIGDVVADPDVDPSTPEFMKLTFNSMAALYTGHFMATEGYVNNNNGTDEIGENVQPDNLNKFGDILVGGTNPLIDLLDVTINTLGLYANALGIGNPGFPQNVRNFGANFQAETLFYNSEDPMSVGLLTITGENDVLLKAVDNSDPEVVAVVINTTDHTGTMVWTGGSPAFIGGDNNGDGNTERLTFTNDQGVDGEIWLGHVWDEMAGNYVIHVDTGSGDAYAGVDASTLSLIETYDHGGYINLGVVADIDSEDFRISNDDAGVGGDGIGADGGGVGTVELCLGAGLDANGVLVVPELSSTGRWEFDNGNGGPGVMILEVKDVILNNGGQLELDGVTVCVTGELDLSQLNVADISLSNTTIEVKAGGKLVLTVEQATVLEDAGFIISGEGTVCVVGESDDTDFGVSDATFSNLRTATVDLSLVTLAATDVDQMLNITASGAEDNMGADLVVGGDRIAQTIIGSANNDAVTVAASASDGDGSTIDVITRLGADGGDIGDPKDTPSGVPDPTEVAGDTIVNAGNAELQIEVDAGFDQVDVLRSGDIVQVDPGAEFYGVASPSFVATSDSTNDGTAVIETTPPLSATVENLDVSAAGGAEGWTLVGAEDDDPAHFGNNLILGSVNDDMIVDGRADAVITPGNNNGQEDTLTGSGGVDTYVFNFADSDPLDFTVDPAMPEPEDYDSLEITSVAGGGGADDAYTVQFRNGQDIDSITISGAATATTGTLAAAIASALNALTNVSAVVDGGNPNLVNITSENGAGFNVTGILESGAGFSVGESFSTAPVFGTDVAQIQMVTIADGNASNGEIYKLEVQLGSNGNIIGDFTATGGEDENAIRAAVIADFNANAGGAVTASAGANDGEIILTDNNADDGGFEVVFSAGTAVVVASSASSVLNGTETTLDQVDADVITDFMVSGADQDYVDFGLVAGSGSTFEDEPFETSYEDAANAAEAAFLADTDLVYVFTGYNDDGVGNADGITGDVGLLFVDANGDNKPDTVLALIGVAEGTFDSDSILGS